MSTSPPVDGATTLADLHDRRDRLASIAERVERERSAEARAALREEIVALFREADAQAAAWAALKAAVKEVASRWKAVDGSPGAGVAAVSSRIDHLGASTYIEKGWSRLSLGDAPGAEEALRRALELSPGHTEAMALLGWAELEGGRTADALLTFQQVLQLDPDHALTQAHVGLLCLRAGRLDAALEHLARALRTGRDRRATLYAQLHLGMVHAARGAIDEAETAFAEALRLGPNLVQAWYELGRARWHAGRVDTALDAWRQGAALSRFTTWGKRCVELVERVERGEAPPTDR